MDRGRVWKLVPLHGTPLYSVNIPAECQESKVKRPMLL